MNYLSLAALIHTDKEGPQIDASWLEETLCDHLGGYAGAPGAPGAPTARSWGVGGVLGTETLVQARPVVRDPQTRFTADFLRAPSLCTIAGFVASSGRPPRFQVTRFHRWIAIAGSPAPPSPDPERDPAAILRAALPGFIERSLIDGSERELIGMTAIARLHAATAMGKTFAAPEHFAEALTDLDRLLGEPPAISVLVSDGRTVGALHRGGEVRALRPPPGRRRTLRSSQASADEASLLLLLSPPEAPPPGPATAAQASPSGIFTVSARQPVRIVGA